MLTVYSVHELEHKVVHSIYFDEHNNVDVLHLSHADINWISNWCKLHQEYMNITLAQIADQYQMTCLLHMYVFYNITGILQTMMAYFYLCILYTKHFYKR